jgi:hypothetical protein
LALVSGQQKPPITSRTNQLIMGRSLFTRTIAARLVRGSIALCVLGGLSGTTFAAVTPGAVKNETAKVPRVGGFASVSDDLNPETHLLRASRVNDVLKNPADWGWDQAR